MVAGRIMSRNLDVEIKIEAEGGLWTSGWIKPEEGFFETPVSLKEGSITTFWVYARDGQGRLLDTDTTEFRVRHGFVPSAPPLPHTLSVEVLNPGGNSVLDPVFAKGTPLPAEKKVKYRAAHALVPDNPESDLAIKLWEGEFRDDPEANEWVGNVVLSNSGVRRSVPEGSDIDVTIKVDVSRLITVEAFVPHLNQHFSGRLYVPQREEQDFSKLSHAVASETNSYRRRLEELEKSPAAVDDESTQSELEDLRSNIDELESKAPFEVNRQREMILMSLGALLSSPKLCAASLAASNAVLLIVAAFLRTRSLQLRSKSRRKSLASMERHWRNSSWQCSDVS